MPNFRKKVDVNTDFLNFAGIAWEKLTNVNMNRENVLTEENGLRTST